MTTTMLDRARELGITIKVGIGVLVTRANSTDARPWDGWDHHLYRVKLERKGQEIRTFFRKGIGHNGSPPTLEEVLDGLVTDASAWLEADGLNDFARNFGITDDPERAVSTYEACKKTHDQLYRLVGPDNLDALLYDTERL